MRGSHNNKDLIKRNAYHIFRSIHCIPLNWVASASSLQLSRSTHIHCSTENLSRSSLLRISSVASLPTQSLLFLAGYSLCFSSQLGNIYLHSRSVCFILCLGAFVYTFSQKHREKSIAAMCGERAANYAAENNTSRLKTTVCADTKRDTKYTPTESRTFGGYVNMTTVQRHAGHVNKTRNTRLPLTIAGLRLDELIHETIHEPRN